MPTVAGAGVHGWFVPNTLRPRMDFSAQSTTKGGSRIVAHRNLITGEPIEPSGVVLTIAELPRRVIFGKATEDALWWASEAIAVQLRATRPIATNSRHSS